MNDVLPPPLGTAMATNMSKKRKFVADGVFYAELNEVSRFASLAKLGVPPVAFTTPSTSWSHNIGTNHQQAPW